MSTVAKFDTFYSRNKWQKSTYQYMSKYNCHLTGQNNDFAIVMAKSPTIDFTVNIIPSQQF